MIISFLIGSLAKASASYNKLNQFVESELLPLLQLRWCVRASGIDDDVLRNIPATGAVTILNRTREIVLQTSRSTCFNLEQTSWNLLDWCFLLYISIEVNMFNPPRFRKKCKRCTWISGILHHLSNRSQMIFTDTSYKIEWPHTISVFNLIST